MDGQIKNSSSQMLLKIDRQLKEQFIHGLNDEEMLAETITDITKCDENTTIHSEMC